MRAVAPGVLFVLMVLCTSADAWASPYPLEEILDKDVVAKLAKKNIKTSDDLLQRGAKAKDRRALARATGLSAVKLLHWTRMCDVLRVKGIGPGMIGRERWDLPGLRVDLEGGGGDVETQHEGERLIVQFTSPDPVRMRFTT